MDLEELKNNPEQIKLLINVLQSLLPDSGVEKQKPKIKRTKKPPKNNKSKTKDNDDTNKFLTMGIKDLHKEDSLIDKALRKFPPTPRNRSFRPVSVVCRSCGKKETISPSLVYESPDRYKCNKCSTNAG